MTILGPSLWKQLLCATSRLSPEITLGPQESSVLKRSTVAAAPGRRLAAVAGQGGTSSAPGQATTWLKGGKVLGEEGESALALSQPLLSPP